MPFDKAMLPEMLLPLGYNTFCVGKWHLTPPEDTTAAGPFDRWPLGRGFERYYGFLGGETNQWYPELTYDNHEVEQPALPEDGYHLSADLADKAIEFIQDAHANAPGQAVLPVLRHRCRARPAPRAQGVGRQVQGQVRRRLGRRTARSSTSARSTWASSPPGTELSAHDPDVPAWDSLSDDAQAAVRPVHGGLRRASSATPTTTSGGSWTSCEEIGELDNTLVIVISDNGASSEGGAVGSLNEMFFFNNVPESLEDNLAR